MAETLLTPSSIKLFGRILTDFSYQGDKPASDIDKSLIGSNNFLQRQLDLVSRGKSSRERTCGHAMVSQSFHRANGREHFPGGCNHGG